MFLSNFLQIPGLKAVTHHPGFYPYNTWTTIPNTWAFIWKTLIRLCHSSEVALKIICLKSSSENPESLGWPRRPYGIWSQSSPPNLHSIAVSSSPAWVLLFQRIKFLPVAEPLFFCITYLSLEPWAMVYSFSASISSSIVPYLNELLRGLNKILLVKGLK